jgi:hypothetical protein
LPNYADASEFNRLCAVFNLRDSRRGDSMTPPSDGIAGFSVWTPVAAAISMRCIATGGRCVFKQSSAAV